MTIHGEQTWEWRCWRLWLVCIKHSEPRSIITVGLEYSPLVFLVVLQGNRTAWALTINLSE
ncbi:hypothetical protein LCGC14_1588230 [marine sediment metagenome]|uniref:Uncharacterized protein n=1 Tax=marine sediment metagenome TaxID=412755 RepID=A0A0F9KVI5_9ZZZZ